MIRESGIYDEVVVEIVRHIESYLYTVDYEAGVENGMKSFNKTKFLIEYIGNDADIAPTIDMDIEYDEEGYVYFIPTVNFPEICLDEDEYPDAMEYAVGLWRDLARKLTQLKKSTFNIHDYDDENEEDKE